MFWKIALRERFGGQGSGNFGHQGRPGEVGGSVEGGGGLQINKLPEKELRNKLKELGGNLAAEPGKVGDRLNGFYDPETEIIYINSNLPKEGNSQFGGMSVNPSQQGTIWHESAHQSYHKYLNSQDRKEWEVVYNKVKPDYWRTQISDKASRGASEALAELYVASRSGANIKSRLNAHKSAIKVFNRLADKLK